MLHHSTPVYYHARRRRIEGVLLLHDDRVEFVTGVGRDKHGSVTSLDGDMAVKGDASRIVVPLVDLYAVHLTPVPVDAPSRGARVASMVRASLKSISGKGSKDVETGVASIGDDTGNEQSAPSVASFLDIGTMNMRARGNGFSGSRQSLADIGQVVNCLRKDNATGTSSFTLFTLGTAGKRPFSKKPEHRTFTFSAVGRDISQNSNTATTSPPNGIPLTVNVDSSACQIAQRWVQLLQAAARRMPLSSNGHDDPLPPHRILVLINPFGGKKEAVAIYETRVAPMFALAGVQATVKLTERAMHAFELARDLDMSMYDAAVTVSGDGLFHEFVNGLMARADRERVCKFPVGIIPGGSGNALAKSVDTPYADLAALNIIKGATRPFDLFHVTQFDGKGQVERRVHGFLELMWALIADVDLESEHLRWAGSSRFTLMAVARVLKLRKYKGKLHYLGNAGAEVRVASTDLGSLRFDHVRPGAVPADWTTVDSDFAYFMAMNVPWCSSDFQVAPAARLGDGSIDLVWIENGTRSKVLRVLLDTESGTYVHEPYVRSERVQAFLLEPDCTQPFGILDLDGEAISYGATLVQMLPQCMRLLVPTGHDENVWQKSGK